jgi:hypothetical protein
MKPTPDTARGLLDQTNTGSKIVPLKNSVTSKRRKTKTFEEEPRNLRTLFRLCVLRVMKSAHKYKVNNNASMFLVDLIKKSKMKKQEENQTAIEEEQI